MFQKSLLIALVCAGTCLAMPALAQDTDAVAASPVDSKKAEAIIEKEMLKLEGTDAQNLTAPEEAQTETEAAETTPLAEEENTAVPVKASVKKATSAAPILPLTDPRGLLAADNFTIQFVQNNHMGADKAVLRVISPAVVTGCAEVMPPSFEKQIQGDRIIYKLQSPAVDVSGDKDKYGKCIAKAQTASVDIPISRAELERWKIHKIGLRSANVTDMFDVDLAAHHMSLIPLNAKAFKQGRRPDGSDPLTYWFLPENTVILYVPGAKRTDALEPQIQKLAMAQGLVPLESVVGGFTKPAQETNTLYFVDMPGYFARRIGRDGKPVSFGKARAEREFYNAKGKQIQEEALDVYARRPQ